MKSPKKVAEYLKEKGCELIFPALTTDGKISDGPNKLLVIVPDAVAQKTPPVQIAAEARSMAYKHLQQEWHIALRAIDFVQDSLDVLLAEAQITNFLEFYAAWVPFNDQNYADARQEVDRLLAGRKALRDFVQPESRDGRAKSPLDPTRDSIFKKISESCETHPRLRLKKTEGLDALSTLKRVRGSADSKALPSVADIAQRTLTPTEAGTQDQEDEKGNTNTDTLPGYAYYAILVADGDKMGALLNTLNEREKHKSISLALSQFAATAKKIVEADGDSGGYCIYAGGDDVVALVPVAQATVYAENLAKAFSDTMMPFREEAQRRSRAEKPVEGGTLSVGIAIVHYRDPLHIALERARAAEKEAKKERGSVAIALHTRGGTPLTVARRWEQYHTEQWKKHFQNDNLPTGFPYELQNLAREMEGVGLSPELIRGEANRILQRKKSTGSESVTLPESATKSPETLHDFAQELIIARFLARKNKGANNG